jgi:hypothetical protein
MTRKGGNDVKKESNKQPLIQIMPVGILFFDEANLPVAFPAFQACLALYSLANVFVDLKVDQRMDMVLLGEAFHYIAFVLIDALDEIGRHTNIQCAVLLAREDINVGLLAHTTCCDYGFLPSQE